MTKNQTGERLKASGNNYYDEGWNAFVDGKPYVIGTQSWRDGWLDAKGAKATQRMGAEIKLAYPKPAGNWMLVPTEPTIEMLNAYDAARTATTMKPPGSSETYNPHQSYWALLAAAPKCPEEECPSHIGSEADPKICRHCGIHVDALR